MNTDDIKRDIVSMAGEICGILDLIEKGFMENKPEPLAEAMRKEGAINDSEKTLTGRILDVSKAAKGKKLLQELSALQQTVETLERMGDEASGIIERIEIKVHENLLFSEISVEQYNETYAAMKESVRNMREFLKAKDSKLKERIIHNGFHVKELVERYRKEHSERLISGLCTPMGANMYFDMLDFTGNLARHSSNIVKLF
jgi:phosphate:Na+ symporter